MPSQNALGRPSIAHRRVPLALFLTRACPNTATLCLRTCSLFFLRPQKKNGNNTRQNCPHASGGLSQLTNVLLHHSTSKPALNVALRSPGDYRMFHRLVWVSANLPQNPVTYAYTTRHVPWRAAEHSASAPPMPVQATLGSASTGRQKNSTTRRCPSLPPPSAGSGGALLQGGASFCHSYPKSLVSRKRRGTPPSHSRHTIRRATRHTRDTAREACCCTGRW